MQYDYGLHLQLEALGTMPNFLAETLLHNIEFIYDINKRLTNK